MFKVIIADDEARLCGLIQLLPDWDVRGMVSNGPSALDIVRQHHPDILITDLRISGCRVLEPNYQLGCDTQHSACHPHPRTYSTARFPGHSENISFCRVF